MRLALRLIVGALGLLAMDAIASPPGTFLDPLPPLRRGGARQFLPHAAGSGSCGDSVCAGGPDENCFTCPQDCSCPAGSSCVLGTTTTVPHCSSCGDGSCQSDVEDCGSCPQDCGCGDGTTCDNGQCICAEHTFTFHIDSTEGATLSIADWPGGSDTQCSGPCCVTVVRPNGRVSDPPLPDAVPWDIAGVSGGYTRCSSITVGAPDCHELTLSHPTVLLGRPVCSNGLCTSCTGRAHDEATVTCHQ
jgi:hypothetical protein